MANDLGQHRYLATVHRPINYEFATEAAMNAGTGYDITDEDLLKFAHVQLDDSVWMLTATGPLTWVAVGSGGGSSLTLSPEAEDILSIIGSVLYLDTQVANTVFAGPASGGDDYPTFRILSHEELYLPPRTVDVMLPAVSGYNVTDTAFLAYATGDDAFGTPIASFVGIITPLNKHSNVYSAPWAIPDDISPGSLITVAAISGSVAGPNIEAYGGINMIYSLVDCDYLTNGESIISDPAADDIQMTKCLAQGTFTLPAGTYVQFRYARDGLNVSDDAGAVIITGFLVTYTALK